MTEPTHERRESDQHMHVLANRIDNLAENIGDLKLDVAEVTKAMVKFIIVEERQTQTFLALDRTALLVDRWMLRQEAHEKECAQQDKDTRALLADTVKDIANSIAKTSTTTDTRIDDLVTDVSFLKRVNGWLVTGVGSILGALVVYFIPRILERGG